MSIDERLERLTERHEALTQTVELMAAENQQRDRRLSEIMEGLARLLHIAEIHEHRLTNLEGGDAR
jgi:archaellum component FlaC